MVQFFFRVDEYEYNKYSYLNLFYCTYQGYNNMCLTYANLYSSNLTFGVLLKLEI